MVFYPRETVSRRNRVIQHFFPLKQVARHSIYVHSDEAHFPRSSKELEKKAGEKIQKEM